MGAKCFWSIAGHGPARVEPPADIVAAANLRVRLIRAQNARRASSAFAAAQAASASSAARCAGDRAAVSCPVSRASMDGTSLLFDLRVRAIAAIASGAVVGWRRRSGRAVDGDEVVAALSGH